MEVRIYQCNKFMFNSINNVWLCRYGPQCTALLRAYNAVMMALDPCALLCLGTYMYNAAKMALGPSTLLCPGAYNAVKTALI